MTKNYAQQVADTQAKEARKAQSMGYTVEQWRKVQADNNRRKAYEAKVAHLRKELERMEQWLAEHPAQ